MRSGKELEDGSKNDDEDDDGGGLQIKGDLKSDTSYNLTRTLTLLTLKQESPCSMLTRGVCTTRLLVTSFTCKNMRNKSVHAQS